MKKTTLFLSSLIALYSCGGGSSEAVTGETNTNRAPTTATAAPAQLAPALTIMKRPNAVSIEQLKSAVNPFIETHGNKHDAVAYCVPTNDGYLFYVAKGNYPSGSYKLGVVDANNNVIIPTEFDRINNLGASVANHFEVIKAGKKGLYNTSGKAVLEAKYDGIYPYQTGSSVIAQIKEGNKYGWVDAEGQTGFELGSFADADLFNTPLDGEILRNWEFNLENPNLHFTHDVSYITEGFPEEAQGMVFMPSYIKDLKLYDDGDIPNYSGALEDGIDMGVDEMGLSIDETKKINNGIWAFVSSFWESGIDGRDYMYEKPSLAVTDQSLKYIDGIKPEISNTRMCDAGINIRFLDGGLVEILQTDGADAALEYGMMPIYTYYQIQDNGQVKKLESNRIFDFTKYVKIDETYFQGCYERSSNSSDQGYDPNSFENNTAMMEHLSIEALDIMRNEIFADYGRKFTTDKWNSYFSKQSWYNGQYDNVDDKLSEIEKHNINIILDMKKKMEGNEDKYIKKELTTYVAAG